MAMRARCRGGDSNSHALRHLILSQARIPFRHPGFIFFTTKNMEARAGLGHGSCALPRARPRPHLAALAAPAARATLRLSPPDETRVRAFLPCQKKTLRVFWRLGRDSNPRIAVLQTAALPLRHRAILYQLLARLALGVGGATEPWNLYIVFSMSYDGKKRTTFFLF